MLIKSGPGNSIDTDQCQFGCTGSALDDSNSGPTVATANFRVKLSVDTRSCIRRSSRRMFDEFVPTHWQSHEPWTVPTNHENNWIACATARDWQ